MYVKNAFCSLYFIPSFRMFSKQNTRQNEFEGKSSPESGSAMKFCIWSLIQNTAHDENMVS